MKNFSFLLVFSVLLFSCNTEKDPDTKIENPKSAKNLKDLSIENGDSGILNAEELYLLLQESFDLPTDYNEAYFSDFTIVVSTPDETGTTSKWLMCSYATGDYNQDFGVQLVNTSAGAAKIAVGGSKTCTCTGCSNGCDLNVVGVDCSCSPCSGSSSNTCKKKETITLPRN